MFNQQQEELRKSDTVKIARQWDCSPYVYGADSKQRIPNPDYHPPICQREDGKFCDMEGRLLPLAKVPEYIRAQGKAPEPTTVVGGEVDLAAAMRSSATPADPKLAPEPVKRKRGRPRKEK